MARTLQNREATIRSYTDHVTHEIKTPVAAIRAAVELLGDGALTAADRALLAQIDGARAQIETQLEALRQAARSREARYLGICTLAELAAKLDHPALMLGLSGEKVPIPLAAQGLLIPLSHLLRNAAEHGARWVEISAEVSDSAVTVTFSDDGDGVSVGNAARIFEPFFTTKREKGGTGMGLSITRNLIEAHGGKVGLIPSTQGATFLLTFPMQ
jgi:signal transduction histidine kinase